MSLCGVRQREKKYIARETAGRHHLAFASTPAMITHRTPAFACLATILRRIETPVRGVSEGAAIQSQRKGRAASPCMCLVACHITHRTLVAAVLFSSSVRHAKSSLTPLAYHEPEPQRPSVSADAACFHLIVPASTGTGSFGVSRGSDSAATARPTENCHLCL